AEQNAAGYAGGEETAHLLGGEAWRHLALDHVAVARGRGVDVAEIGDRSGDIGIKTRLVEDAIGAARRRDRLVAGPAVARAHEAQIVEAAIQHRAGRRADTLAELRLDEDDRRAARHAAAASIRPGHRYSRRQVVVPSGLSSRTTPSARSSARMRSASAK